MPAQGAGQFPSAIGTEVFATESCMGCHSAAGLHRRYAKDPRNSTRWPKLSADFSWLPEREAAQAGRRGHPEGHCRDPLASPLIRAAGRVAPSDMLLQAGMRRATLSANGAGQLGTPLGRNCRLDRQGHPASRTTGWSIRPCVFARRSPSSQARQAGSALPQPGASGQRARASSSPT